MVNLIRNFMRVSRRAAYGREGQFLLPALIIIPIVVLVIYLIADTAALSKEKIKQQFALDAAAFVELQPTVTLLNAAAYVNAAFPYRVYSQVLMDEKLKFANRGGNDEGLTVYDWFYKGGAFPGASDKTQADDWMPKNTDQEWNLKYAAGTRPGWDVEEPESPGDKVMTMNSKDVADYYYADHTLLAQAIDDYINVQAMLGDLFEKQSAIEDKISKNGMFFRASYSLNTGCGGDSCGKEGTLAFSGININMKAIYIKKMLFYYSKLVFGDIHAGPEEYELPIEKFIESGKLFQFAYLDSASRKTLKGLKRKGIEVEQPYTTPNNYFGVDLSRMSNGKPPYVRAKVTLECPAESNNCIWPKATSKYQLRLTP